MSQRRKKPGRAKRPARAARRQKTVAAIPLRPGMMRVRRSRVHGRGVFALRRIRKGTRIIEYLGDRVSHRQADLRYEHKDISDNHTFLFIVDRSVVIDGGSNGNEARFINHSCDPNCDAIIENDRIWIETIRDIAPGEELAYDYAYVLEERHSPAAKRRFPCHCGAATCRGTILAKKR